MAVTRKVGARELGRAFAKIVRDEPVVKELWVETQPEEIRLWLVVDPIGLDDERHLQSLTSPLYQRFPETSFTLLTLNPRYHVGDVHRALPSWAERIPLHPD